MLRCSGVRFVYVLLDYALTKGIKTGSLGSFNHVKIVLLDYALTKGIKTVLDSVVSSHVKSYWTTP